MRTFFWRCADQRLRDKLFAAIESSDLDLDGKLNDDTSLIKSGILDSLGLFNVALTIEHEIGPELDLASFDLSQEWDTIAGMLQFAAKYRRRGAAASKKASPSLEGAS